MGNKGILTGNATGRGSVIIRAKTHTETLKGNTEAIIVDEIPYQVNKAKLVERIAELVKEKIVEDISDLRDESDRTGVRVVIELKRGANSEVVLNQLYKHTPLQTSFGYNMLALDRGRPRLMGVREILQCFLLHREEVITRRTRFQLTKARDRAHILAGLATAVANIDEVIAIIRNAPDPTNAKQELMNRSWPAEPVRPLIELLGERLENATLYNLSDRQAQAILDLRLHRLTGLERDKINEEATAIAETIKGLLDILSNRSVLLAVMRDELREVREQFATPRRTEIIEGSADVDLEDLIQPEDMVVTISSDGYVKRLPMSTYRAQRRGGKGRSLGALRENEEMSALFVANTHDPLLFFTTTGKVYTLKVYNLPQASTQARGKAFVNLLPLEKDETVMSVVPIPRNDDWQGQYLLFATRLGVVRKTPLTAFANVRSSGIKGIGLNDGDILIDVRLCPNDEGDVLISSKNGQAVRFPLETLRPIASRTAAGVRGMSLRDKDEVISMHLIRPDETVSGVLSVTANGYGKRTKLEDFPSKSRGTMGVIAIQTSKRNGSVVTSMPVGDADQVMIATSDGQVIRMKVDGISTMGRNTQGVRLFDVGGKATVSLCTRISADMLEDRDDDGTTVAVEDLSSSMPDLLEGVATDVEATSNEPDA